MATQLSAAAKDSDALRELSLHASDVAELRSFTLELAETYRPF